MHQLHLRVLGNPLGGMVLDDEGRRVTRSPCFARVAEHGVVCSAGPSKRRCAPPISSWSDPSSVLVILLLSGVLWAFARWNIGQDALFVKCVRVSRM